jgi:hypothetical protein
MGLREARGSAGFGLHLTAKLGWFPAPFDGQAWLVFGFI